MDKYLTWIKAHEKLLIVLLSALLVFHFYNRVIDAWVQHDKIAVAVQQTQAQTAQQKVEQDTVSNTVLLKELADLKLQFSVIEQQTQANTVKRQTQTDTQKAKNETATVPEIIARFRTVTANQQLEITPSTSNSDLVFTDQASRIVLNQLEDGRNAQDNLVDTNKTLAVCTAVNNKQNETISGLQTQLTDEKKSHVADVTLEQDKTKLAKDEGKRQFRRGFKWGAIIGFLGGIAVFHKI